MGKTETGAIWLDKKFLSSYDTGTWRNTDDRDVIKFLKYFTDLELEIDKIKSNDINQLKILLANKTTTMLHGEKAAIQSEKAAKEAFSVGSAGSNLPTVKISRENLDKINIIELIILSELENSKSEIRRLIKGNAIKLNNKIIDNDKLIITNKIFEKNYLKLSIGKKRHIKIELD